MKRFATALLTAGMFVSAAWAQKASTGTFTSPAPRVAPLPQGKAPAIAAPSSAAAQARRQLILQQRQDRIAFEQKYKAGMQSTEASIKGQTPAQQAAARAQAQQQWRAQRKALLDSQRQARQALNNQK